MAYLIEAYLAPKADAAVRHLWRVLNERGISDSNLRNDSTPHLTLVTAESLDEPVLHQALSRVAERAAVPLTLRGLALFPGERTTLYLPVVPSFALLDLHRAAAEAVREAGGEPRGAEGWTPHVSLARRLSPVALPGAVGALHDQNLQIETSVMRIGLLRDRPIVRLGEWELGDKEQGKRE